MGPSQKVDERRKVVTANENRAWQPSDRASYSYALGMYLGDGHITHRPRKGAFLRIVLDRRYPGIVTECAEALSAALWGARVCRFERRDRSAVVLQVSGWSVLLAFPQHGSGKKHNRPIRLDPWQARITAEFPRELLRGLVHSDGCRVINGFNLRLPSGQVRHYEYPRYFFSNLSADIRRIFCTHCDLLGIAWTQSNPRNISVSDRVSVAKLDTFIGAKT